MGEPEPGVRLCPACGYGLEGLPEQGGKVRCPECGAEYVTARVQLILPWPSKLAVCGWLGGPTAALGVLSALLRSFDSTVGTAFVLDLLAIVVGISMPFVGAAILVYRHVAECGRTRPLYLLILGGWLLNVAIVVVIDLAMGRFSGVTGLDHFP